MTEAPSLRALSDRVKQQFLQRWGEPPTDLAAAPGRVNIIGEHTDYNDGFVLPMAIQRYTVVAAAPTSEHENFRVFSCTMGESCDIPLSDTQRIELPTWGCYVRGVIDVLQAAGWELQPANLLLDSTVPLGGGLSSSAALEVALATLIESMLGKTIEPKQKALFCQKAEHEGVGMPCGIMDQFSSVLCEEDHLMLLDCRSQEVKMIAMDDPAVTVLITNSNVKHELTGGEYAERRTQCEEAAEMLGVSSLRDATLAQLELARDQLSEVHFRRARHVIGEIARTPEAAEQIEGRNWRRVGELMYASHAALRDDFEVSCAELDVLVDIAAQIGESGGVIGSRMTGGGFGGSTVTLVAADKAEAVAQALGSQYKDRVGIEATSFVSRPGKGAHLRNL